MLYLRHTILMLDMENQSDIIIVLAMLVGILYRLYLVLCTIQSQVLPVTTSRSGNSQCKRQQRNTSMQRSTKANERVLVSLITGALGVLKIWSA